MQPYSHNSHMPSPFVSATSFAAGFFLGINNPLLSAACCAAAVGLGDLHSETCVSATGLFATGCVVGKGIRKITTSDITGKISEYLKERRTQLNKDFRPLMGSYEREFDTLNNLNYIGPHHLIYYLSMSLELKRLLNERGSKDIINIFYGFSSTDISHIVLMTLLLPAQLIECTMEDLFSGLDLSKCQTSTTLDLLEIFDQEKDKKFVQNAIITDDPNQIFVSPRERLCCELLGLGIEPSTVDISKNKVVFFFMGKDYCFNFKNGDSINQVLEEGAKYDLVTSKGTLDFSPSSLVERFPNVTLFALNKSIMEKREVVAEKLDALLDELSLVTPLGFQKIHFRDVSYVGLAEVFYPDGKDSLLTSARFSSMTLPAMASTRDFLSPRSHRFVVASPNDYFTPTLFERQC
jgi:hypothetical protein